MPKKNKLYNSQLIMTTILKISLFLWILLFTEMRIMIIKEVIFMDF